MHVILGYVIPELQLHCGSLDKVSKEGKSREMDEKKSKISRGEVDITHMGERTGND